MFFFKVGGIKLPDNSYKNKFVNEMSCLIQGLSYFNVFFHTEDEICHKDRTVWNRIQEYFWWQNFVSSLERYSSININNHEFSIHCSGDDEYFASVQGVDCGKLVNIYEEWRESRKGQHFYEIETVMIYYIPRELIIIIALYESS
jgi:hypothetical protein